MKKSSSPEKQNQIEAIADILRNISIGETASYSRLSAAAGYLVQDQPFTLITARKRVEKETGIRFATVRSVGVKKIAAEDVAGIGSEARRRIARSARRHHGRLSALRYNDISPKLQARIDAERSLLGAISQTAKLDVVKVAEETTTGPVVASRILDLIAR